MLREITIGLLSVQERRIRELGEARELARQARFGSKGEAFTGEQRQLVEEDIAADRAGITRQLRELMPGRDGPKKKPVRAALPAHLPREEAVLNLTAPRPAPTAAGSFATSSMKSVKTGVHPGPLYRAENGAAEVRLRLLRHR